MNDQSIMENLLLTTKGVCDLYPTQQAQQQQIDQVRQKYAGLN